MTTYVHPLEGPHSIADWFAGSTLQPFLERLGDEERCEFLARYRTGLKDAYPVQPTAAPCSPTRGSSSSRSRRRLRLRQFYARP